MSGKVLLNIWRWANILSLDVCAGAIAGGIMAVSLLGSSPGLAYWLVLPLAVWLIYTADHLIDGYRAGVKAQHDRRLIHRDNLKILVIIISILFLIISITAFLFLPERVIIFGLCLGMLVLVYLLIVYFIGKRSASFLPKELFVAIFYTAGIWGPVIVINTGVAGIEVFLLFIIFFILAFEDLILLSHIESIADQKEGQSSLAIVLGNSRTRKMLNIIGASVLTISILLLIMSSSHLMLKASLILFCMQFSILLILRFSEKLRRNDLYRYLSEAVFLMPALMLI